MINRSKSLLISIFGILSISNVFHANVSDCVVASVNDIDILASDIGKKSLIAGFRPISLSELVDFHALVQKAKGLAFFTVSQYKIEEYKKGLLEMLGLSGKDPAEVDAGLKDQLQTNLETLTSNVEDFLRVGGLIDTFVHARASTVYKGDIEAYCEKHPEFHPESFTVQISQDFSKEAYNQARLTSFKDEDFQTALGFDTTAIEVVLDQKSSSPDLFKAVSQASVGELSSPMKSHSDDTKVFVFKVIKKVPKTVKSVAERRDQVSESLLKESRELLYKHLVEDARRECAIKYYETKQ